MKFLKRFSLWAMANFCLHFKILIIMIILFSTIIKAEDYYDLLGISKSATSKEIRKAFKKLAISLHPDKNKDDPKSHDKFLKINRAYEVLKDADLRKKYDTYGEDGLKDDFHGGGHYESWQWYQENFGIYDDDPEIITLSRIDFEQSVEGTEDVWFINFYSPHCSHCHHLAPDWRKLAREMEGVIRIGAVNCEDEWQLCRMQGIRGYPSLLIYPLKEKYFGDKNAKALVKYAMKHVKARVHELWRGNYRTEVEEDESDLPWLITFCGDGGDCLGSTTCLKVASMLEDLVQVGSLNCQENEDLCDKLGRNYGSYFYQPHKVKKGEGLEITSLVAQEIARSVLSQLPDVTVLDAETFEDIREKLKTGQDRAWLIHFVEDEGGQDLELRKLPVMLDDFHIGRVDCRVMKSECNDLHVLKFPSFMVFKQRGGSEVYYGRLTAHDVAAFARDSAVTPLEALGPSDFPHRVVLSNDPWFVDFFAPWCPPCMRLLPEVRKAAKHFGETVNFGTVDCTIHSGLCNNYNIRSYPTTIFYNQTKPHQYHGHHSADDIVEFLKDTLNPPVLSLTMESFKRLIIHKKRDDVWLVDFFASWCGPCQQLAPEWRLLAKMVKDTKNLHVAMVDCQEERGVCNQQEVHSYPTMRLYPSGTTGSDSYFTYNGWHRDAHSLRAWAYEFLPSKVKTIKYSNFQPEVLQSTDPWIIDFYAPWCGHCQVFRPEFEKVAEQVEGIAKAGKVDCDSEPWVCQNAGINAYPTVRFYRGLESGHHEQHPYGWDIESQNADQIINFIKTNVKNTKPMVHDEF